jgi:predicted lipase
MDVNSDGAEETAATYQSRCVSQFTIKLRLVTRNLARRVDQFDAMQGTKMRLEQTLKPTVLNLNWVMAELGGVKYKTGGSIYSTPSLSL